MERLICGLSTGYLGVICGLSQPSATVLDAVKKALPIETGIVVNI